MTPSPDFPDSFVCPISQELMTDPVVASDGHSYERSCIEDWIHSCTLKGMDATSPKTNERLPHHHLTPNFTLRSSIHEFLEKQQRVAAKETQELYCLGCSQSNHKKSQSRGKNTAVSTADQSLISVGEASIVSTLLSPLVPPITQGIRSEAPTTTITTATTTS